MDIIAIIFGIIVCVFLPIIVCVFLPIIVLIGILYVIGSAIHAYITNEENDDNFL